MDKLLICILALFLEYSNAISVQWTFLSGNIVANSSYVLDSNYSYPGPRYWTAGQTDPSGTFWFYGGYSDLATNKYCSDLWSYNSTTWTYFASYLQDSQGSCGGAPYFPPNLYAALSWINGTDYWIYGGLAHIVSAGKYMDGLWKEDTTAVQAYTSSGWTYVSTKTTCNSPIRDTVNATSTRSGSVTWVYNGELYFFGGIEKTFGFRNDVWKYDGAWNYLLSYSSTSGNYVDQGISSTNSYPAARYFASNWFDNSNGTLWMYGGSQAGAAYSDLWRLDSNLTWTWLSGDATVGNSPSYGNLGELCSTNSPGARKGASNWIDDSGRFWLFGGSDGGTNIYNDLWVLDPTVVQWAWVSGPNTPNANVSITYPGARVFAANFGNPSSILYLFGGDTINGATNDFWSFSISGSLTTC